MAVNAPSHIHIKRKQLVSLLHEVSDPEIPGISIVDLGMVLDIRNDDDQWEIILAPTYSGCPAIDVIPFIVQAQLKEAGIHDVKISMDIAPPWSTDWISEEGKTKLLSYGIAPPNGPSTRRSDDGHPKACPQCGSSDTELISRFSSTPCKAAYRCLNCLEPFEYFKCF